MRRRLLIAVALIGVLTVAALLVSGPFAPSQGSAVGTLASVNPTATPLSFVVPATTSSRPTDRHPPGDRATLIRVVDGDTVHGLVDGVDESIRIIGLDSPESHKPGTPSECYALEATAAAKRLLSAGDVIYLQADATQARRDRYGRLLAHLFLANGDLFAEKMIEGGWAVHYIYGGTPSIYADRLAAAQDRAEAAQAGLWSPKTCDGNAHAPTSKP